MLKSSFLEFDYSLVDRCASGDPRAWEDFVDRFMDLTLRVVDSAAERRARRLSEDERAEMCEAIFRALRYNDFQLLREFSKQSAVSTYLAVVARRVALALLDEE